MSGSTLGTLFRVTNFGESHGPAIGCIVDGCPPGMVLSEADIQPELDRRRPGTSRHVTQRKEEDKVEILSGVFEGRTTGTPIASADPQRPIQRSKDYANIAQHVSARSRRLHVLAKIRYPRLRVAAVVQSARLKPRPTRRSRVPLRRKWLRENVSACARPTVILAQIGPRSKFAFEGWQHVGRKSVFRRQRHRGAANSRSFMDQPAQGRETPAARVSKSVASAAFRSAWGEPVYGKLDSDIAQLR